MKDQKKKAIVDLIETANNLDMSSIMILACGANMLKAKEKLDQKKTTDDPTRGPDTRRAG